MANILMADDEAIITMHLERYVASIGHTVVGIAYNAEEAIDKARKNRPDLVLMDVVMPGADGIMAAATIIGELDIPVIFLTAYEFCEYIERSVEVGSYAYLIKPFKDYEIKASIQIALHKKSTERQLRASEARYRTLVETALEGILQMDQNDTVVFVNPAMAQMFGYGPTDIVGTNVEVLTFPEDLPHQAERMTELRLGRSEVFEDKFRHQDGSAVWCIVSARSLMNHDGTFGGSFAVFTDITKRKISEEKVGMLASAIEQERDNLSSMLVSSPIGMLVINGQEKIVFANQAAEDLFGKTIFDLTHKRFGDIIACVNRLKETAGCGHSPDCPTCPFFSGITGALTEGKAVRDKEALIRTDDKNGNKDIWVLFSVSPFVLDKKNCVIMAIYDITERRRAQSQILAALREKEVLLREIHHRVKNNLQVISSMYGRRPLILRTKKILEAFRESQNRIRSMSLIHDKLYQSRNLAEINIADYISSLVGDLCISYGVDDSHVRIKHSVADTDLNLDAIIPCGLIINELVSNAIKHAFPENRTGTILVRFDKNGDNCILSVKDDGIGFTGTSTSLEESTSMGLQLVSILVDQLEGTIQLNKDRGTEFIITFNVDL
jgi:PAS domain S-box-containing protein